MQLDDKYWALFLVSLFVIAYMMICGRETKESIESLFRLAVYGLAAYLLVFCLPVYALLIRLFPQMDSYYELGYMVPMLPVISAAMTMIAMRVQKGEQRRLICLFAGAVVLLAFAGDFAYIPTNQHEWMYDCTAEEKQVFDMILAYEAGREQDDEISIWGMHDLMIKSEFYDDAFAPVYGKDILWEKQAYSENVQSMFEGYEKYCSPDNKAVMLREYLYAIAGLPYLYEETECDYVIVYDPEWQLEQSGKRVNLKKEEVLQIFEERGYKAVGSTQQKMVFCKAENR